MLILEHQDFQKALRSPGECSFLILYNNTLNGCIPPQIGRLTKLVELYLDNNLLRGSIPSELARLRELRDLSLQNNYFVGSIPMEIGSLLKLETMILADNQFAGSIPTSFGNLVNLKYLCMQNNQLTGSIPREFGHLVNLETLDLSDNQLKGKIPLELSNLLQLKTLYLYNNEFSGIFPEEIFKLQKLETINVANNRLHGSISFEIAHRPNLKFITENNQLSGWVLSRFNVITQLRNNVVSVNWTSHGECPLEILRAFDSKEILLKFANDEPIRITDNIKIVKNEEHFFTIYQSSFEIQIRFLSPQNEQEFFKTISIGFFNENGTVILPIYNLAPSKEAWQSNIVHVTKQVQIFNANTFKTVQIREKIEDCFPRGDLLIVRPYSFAHGLEGIKIGEQRYFIFPSEDTNSVKLNYVHCKEIITEDEEGKLSEKELNDKISQLEKKIDIITKENESLKTKQSEFTINPDKFSTIEDIDKGLLNLQNIIGNLHYKRTKMQIEQEKQEESLCCVCQENERCIVFKPCGHICTCVTCCKIIKECPLCRKSISDKMRIFL